MKNLLNRLVGETTLVGLTLVFLTSTSLYASTVPTGLTLVNESEQVKIYQKPGADLSKYSGFNLASLELSFDEKWLTSYNRERKSILSRLDEQDLLKIGKRYEERFRKVLANTLASEGQAKLVDALDGNTLRVEANIVNLKVSAPDKQIATRTTYLVRRAGEAELHSKMYDAKTGELIMMIIDTKRTREHLDLFETNRVRNQFEFNNVYRAWAKNWLIGLQQNS